MKYSTCIRAIILIGFALPAAAFATDAKDIWTSSCARCHGADGAGQTKIGKVLHVKDYSNADIQAKLTDEQITNAIVDGVKENGKQRMSSFKDKLSPDETKAMVGFVRSLKK